MIQRGVSFIGAGVESDEQILFPNGSGLVDPFGVVRDNWTEMAAHGLKPVAIHSASLQDAPLILLFLVPRLCLGTHVARLCLASA